MRTCQTTRRGADRAAYHRAGKQTAAASDSDQRGASSGTDQATGNRPLTRAMATCPEHYGATHQSHEGYEAAGHTDFLFRQDNKAQQ